MNDESVCVVITTVGDREIAHSLARRLVEQSLAACVQIDGPIDSVYRWNGEVCEDAEYRLLIKSVRSRWPDLCDFIGQNHPYQTPQLIQLAADQTSDAYLSWVRSCVAERF
jgi:periplasmic divalent cation tolerance protein